MKITQYFIGDIINVKYANFKYKGNLITAIFEQDTKNKITFNLIVYYANRLKTEDFFYYNSFKQIID